MACIESLTITADNPPKIVYTPANRASASTNIHSETEGKRA